MLMPRVTIVVLSAVIALLNQVTSPQINAQQTASAQKPNRDEVLKVFKRAIELNEDFKNTGKAIPVEEHQRKRASLEQYHEEVLSPKLAECVKLLASGNDGHLAIEFFKWLISHENSASEEFSFALGETFLNNPSLIETTLRKFTTSERRFLYGQLKVGLGECYLSEGQI